MQGLRRAVRSYSALLVWSSSSKFLTNIGGTENIAEWKYIIGSVVDKYNYDMVCYKCNKNLTKKQIKKKIIFDYEKGQNIELCHKHENTFKNHCKQDGTEVYI